MIIDAIKMHYSLEKEIAKEHKTWTPDSELTNLKDEEYLIFRAKEGQAINPYEAKSWLITAQTIFPKDFAIQFEIYKISKQEKNIKEASKCLNSLFQNFSTETALWVEFDAILALLFDASSEVYSPSTLLSKIFFALPKETQKNVILAAVERSKDEMSYVSLMLLLTSSFPEDTANNGLPLVNALMKAEKNSSDALNPFRKKLVCELLPRFLRAEGLEVRPKLLYLLLSKAIEFFLVYSTTPLKVAMAKLELENPIEDPGQDLFSILRLIGWNLGWELAAEFDIVSNRDLIFQKVQNMVEGGARLGGRKGDNGEDVREVFFVTVTIFIHALLDYTRRLMPETVVQDDSSNSGQTQPPMTLVEAFTTPEKEDFNFSSMGRVSPKMLLSPSTSKRIRLSIEDEELPAFITVSRLDCSNPVSTPDTPSYPFAGAISSSQSLSSGAVSVALVSAIKSWNLIRSYESLRNEFSRFSTELGLTKWLTMFNLDVLIYEGQLAESETQIRLALSQPNINDRNPHLTTLMLNLKLASVLYSLNKFYAATEAVLQIVDQLGTLKEGGGLNSNLTVVSSPFRRHLHVLALTKSQCVQFIVTLLINSLRQLVVNENNQTDSCLGHLVILTQYEWPKHCHVFTEVIEVIRKKGSFSFKYFAPYVTTADMLEEFMFLSNSFGIALDILPLPNTTKQQRMSTRGADRDSKQDFKSAMKKQMLRSFESVESNILSYLKRHWLYIPHVFL